MPDEAMGAVTEAVMTVLAVHRWKSMGVASVECECGAILYGDESLAQFPADEAFRHHLATAALEAAAPVIRAAAAAAEREACALLADAEAAEINGKGCGAEPEALWRLAGLIRARRP